MANRPHLQMPDSGGESKILSLPCSMADIQSPGLTIGSASAFSPTSIIKGCFQSFFLIYLDVFLIQIKLEKLTLLLRLHREQGPLETFKMTLAVDKSSELHASKGSVLIGIICWWSYMSSTAIQCWNCASLSHLNLEVIRWLALATGGLRSEEICLTCKQTTQLLPHGHDNIPVSHASILQLNSA